MPRVVITLVDKDDGQVELRAEFEPQVERGRETSAQIVGALMLAAASQASEAASRQLVAGTLAAEDPSADAHGEGITTGRGG